MARGRMINRGVSTDSKFNSLKEYPDQWLYMRMLPFMDDHGRLTGNLFELKYQTIPSSSLSESKIRESLDNIASAKLIRWVENVTIQFLGFRKNQKIGHKPADSIYLPITEDTAKDQQRSTKLVKDANNISKYNSIKVKEKKEKYRARPKSVEMVIEFFKEKNNTDPTNNAIKFYNHYEARDWHAGKSKIKSWRHCYSSWNFDEDKTSNSLSSFRLDRSGFYIGYCESCGDSQSYNKYELHQDSRCCKEKILSQKVKKG